jgi:hypothetical protein
MSKILRYPVVLTVIAFYLYLSGSAPFLGQWDSYDYLKQIVSHQLSALGFGRPVYLGYNILLWESMRHVFHLEPMKVEAVVMMGTVLLGVFGVVLFQKLARYFLSRPAHRMAALALAVSPMYALYSGFIMTEVPMLVALMGSALLLMRSGDRPWVSNDVASGILFGMAIGIREQAVCMGAAFIWILYSRRQIRIARFHSMLLFSSAAAAGILIPVLPFYFSDPAGFLERTRIWLHAIPMGQIQFWNNVQASLLYTIVVCPAAWLAVTAAGLCAFLRRRVSGTRGNGQGERPASDALIRNPISGVLCCIVLPVAALWRDADVQIHPRYLMIILPASLIFCASIYSRWIRSTRGPLVWAILHVLVFGAGVAALSPFRQSQTEKMEFARRVRDSVPGEALIIAGSYSPILDYYRGIGVRPEWRILWSGWDWNPGAAESAIRQSWADQVPVYFSEDPLGWRYFESDYLSLYYFLKDCRKESVLPKLVRAYPE